MQRRPRPFRPTWTAIRSCHCTPAPFATTARSDAPDRRIEARCDMAVILDTTASRPRHPEKAHRPDTATLRKPDWIRVKVPGSDAYVATRRIVREHGLHTVCEEAGCPNIGECWEARHATMMIMGDVC